MHLNGFDLNLLVPLEALLIEKSVTRAAKRLNVTQPAMSNALQRIRAHFNDQILTRKGNNLELTPLGQNLTLQVRDIISSASALVKSNLHFNPGVSTRTFRLIMSDYFATILLPNLTTSILQEAPNIKIEVDQLNSSALNRLLDQEVDLCFSVNDLGLFETQINHGAFSRKEVFSDSFVCVMSANHPKASNGITITELIEYPHVIATFGKGTTTLEQETMRKHGVYLNAVVSVTNFNLVPILIENTNLIATIPRQIAHRSKNKSNLIISECPIEFPKIVETMFWHNQSDYDHGNLWLRNKITNILFSL